MGLQAIRVLTLAVWFAAVSCIQHDFIQSAQQPNVGSTPIPREPDTGNAYTLDAHCMAPDYPGQMLSL